MIKKKVNMREKTIHFPREKTFKETKLGLTHEKIIRKRFCSVMITIFGDIKGNICPVNEKYI